MTWQFLMSVFDSRIALGGEVLHDEPRSSALFACRCDAGFGLPLIGTLFTESIFDTPAADAGTGSAEQTS